MPPRLPIYSEKNEEKFRALSPRQMECLLAVCDGLTNKEIADKWGTSDQVIKNHLHVVFIKLGVDSRTNAIRHAVRAGWVSLC